jgi:hypothetical protein
VTPATEFHSGKLTIPGIARGINNHRAIVDAGDAISFCPPQDQEPQISAFGFLRSSPKGLLAGPVTNAKPRQGCPCHESGEPKARGVFAQLGFVGLRFQERRFRGDFAMSLDPLG